jgi:hypothetical protein
MITTIINCCLAALYGGALFLALRKLTNRAAKPTRHDCQWVAVAAQQVNVGLFAPAQPKRTIVLWHCSDCSAVETTTIDGHWTITDILDQHVTVIEAAPPEMRVGSIGE